MSQTPPPTSPATPPAPKANWASQRCARPLAWSAVVVAGLLPPTLYCLFAQPAHGMLGAGWVPPLLLGLGGSGLALAWMLARRAMRRNAILHEQVQALNAELRGHEDLTESVLNSSLDAVIRIDQNSRVLHLNPVAERMFGHSLQQALGQNIGELIVPPRLRDAHKAGMWGHLLEDEPHALVQRLEAPALRKDGSEFMVELTLVQHRNSHGCRHFTATLRDISERLRTEQALRESLELLDETGDIGDIGGWSFDIRTQTLSWTAQTVRILDLDPQQHPNLQQTLSLFEGEAQTQLREAMQISIARGDGFDMELPLLTSRGRKLWVRMVARPDLVDGISRRLTGAVQDITARRRVEEALSAAHARELQVGSRIQQSLLVTPAPAQFEQLLLSSFNRASQGVDGDFIEIFHVGPHSMDLIVGDVMGKGLAAAMLGAATKLEFGRAIAQLRMMHTELPQPREVVQAVHHNLTPTLQQLDAFVTLCYLRLDTQRGCVSWVGCGHEEPLLLGPSHNRALHNQHPPIGVLDDSNYVQDEMHFAPGELLFLCSDGVSDALLPDGDRLGHERLTEMLQHRQRLHATPGAVLQGLRLDMAALNATVVDDLTLLAVKFADTSTSVLKRLELPASLGGVAPLRAFIESSIEPLTSLPEGQKGLIAVAGVEAFTNIVRHARSPLEGAPVEVLLKHGEQELELELIHTGEAFQPATPPQPKDLLDYPEGGFGLHIIHSTFDDVHYEHRDGLNSVRMCRRLDHDAA